MPRWDLHTHYYPEDFFRLIEEIGGAFSFAKSPTGQTIIRYNGARFFGITPPMTDPQKRLDDMDRVGIDVEVLSLSTPNVYFAPPERQAEVARLVNDGYAELIAKHPTRFKGFASIPMDDPDAALRVRARSDRRIHVRPDSCRREALLRRRLERAAAHPLDPRSSRRRRPVCVRAPRQRVARLRRVPREDRRAAIGVPAPAVLRH